MLAYIKKLYLAKMPISDFWYKQGGKNIKGYLAGRQDSR